SRRMVVSHRHGVQVGAWAGRNGAGALADAALAGGAGRGADRDPMDPVIAKGTCFPLFAFDVARAIDLDAAERRILAGTERQTVKQRRRAPANFEYRPAPLRVTRQGDAHVLGAYRTAPTPALWTEHAHTVAQVLRAEPRTLSQQEVADATTSRLSFGPDDATFIDTDATLLFDAEGDDVRAVLEFANIQLLEMRFLDQQL